MKLPISTTRILQGQYFLLKSLAIGSILVNGILLFLLLREQDYHWQTIAWQDWGDLAFQIMTSILLLLLAHQMGLKYHTYKQSN